MASNHSQLAGTQEEDRKRTLLYKTHSEIVCIFSWQGKTAIHKNLLPTFMLFYVCNSCLIQQDLCLLQPKKNNWKLFNCFPVTVKSSFLGHFTRYLLEFLVLCICAEFIFTSAETMTLCLFLFSKVFNTHFFLFKFTEWKRMYDESVCLQTPAYLREPISLVEKCISFPY